MTKDSSEFIEINNFNLTLDGIKKCVEKYEEIKELKLSENQLIIQLAISEAGCEEQREKILKLEKYIVSNLAVREMLTNKKMMEEYPSLLDLLSEIEEGFPSLRLHFLPSAENSDEAPGVETSSIKQNTLVTAIKNYIKNEHKLRSKKATNQLNILKAKRAKEALDKMQKLAEAIWKKPGKKKHSKTAVAEIIAPRVGKKYNGKKYTIKYIATKIKNPN